MKLRILAIGIAWTFVLSGQKKFSWQDACFNNPGAPFCQGHDFAVKKGGKSTGGAYSGSEPGMPSSIDAAGIDWRFADPAADALAVLNCAKLSPLAHTLIDRLGGDQSLFRALSGVGQIALSVREDRIVILVTGRAEGSILPASDAGWKSVSVAGKALLIGHIDAVDQAEQRLLRPMPLSNFATMALQRTGEDDFWAVGSAKLAGPDAVAAGVKLFSLKATMKDRLLGDTAYGFEAPPDATKIQAWMNTLGNAKVDGDTVRVALSMETDEVRQSKLAASLLGQRLGVFVKTARYLPVRDTAATVHNKPVIYGLDDGPREVNTPAAPEPPPARPAPQPAFGLTGVWAFTHFNGRFLGTVDLHQNGTTLSGSWHTSSGGSEADSAVAGRIDGNTITLTRFVGNNQTYVLTLSGDGSRLDGFGEGWFLRHTNLNMQRAMPAQVSSQK